MESTPGIQDGFELLIESRFEIPKGFSILDFDFRTKRDLTICHLFVNKRKEVEEIVWLLDEDRRTVINALLEHSIVRDRRTKPRTMTQGDRQKSLSSLRLKS